jgi:hypothetical protein
MFDERPSAVPCATRRGGRRRATAITARLLLISGIVILVGCTTPGPGPTACPLPGYPTAACTGVPAGTSLTTHNGGLVVTTPGQVINGLRITGTVDIRAHDVVIRNSEIHGNVFNDSSGTRYRFTIEDSTIAPPNGCSSWGNGAVGVSNYTARRVRISGFPDGFRVAGSNILIENSFVTLCSANPEDHSDGIQAYGAANGTNIVIRHNTIDQRAVTNGAATAPIFVPNDGERQGNQNVTVSITDNLLAGGGYSLRLYGNLPFSAPAVTGNKIVDRSWAYGPVDLTCSNIGTWAGNATVTYDWSRGRITSQVRALDDC